MRVAPCLQGRCGNRAELVLVSEIVATQPISALTGSQNKLAIGTCKRLDIGHKVALDWSRRSAGHAHCQWSSERAYWFVRGSAQNVKWVDLKHN